MKIYNNLETQETISVTDSGYGFPLPTFIAEIGMQLSKERHKSAVEESVKDFIDGEAMTVYEGSKLEAELAKCEFVEEI